MSDIRMIRCDENGVIEITAEYMDIPLTPLEAAIQRFVIALMTTQGTMVDASGWGGSLRLLLNSLRKINVSDTEKEFTRVLDATLLSLLDSEPDVDFRITDLTLKSLERKGRGYSVVIDIAFANAVNETVTISE